MRILLALVALVVIGSIFGGRASSDRPDSPTTQAGYFKSASNDRVFTFSYQPSATPTQLRSRADAAAYTQGQMTAVYFYPAGATIPRDGVTTAKSLPQANRVLYELDGMSKWDYAYMRDRSGGVRFIDCKAAPGSDLCRQ
ncbi:MAG TPA: hypothetical protein DEP32_05575 [Pseudomonas sp.]|nr:hypothetical protein [Pseudomonas sp.]MBB51967.1 hypothetical protein [Pseudomonadales bacterium]HCA23621.1 hypothetical protein [Pseudomonas sp.]|tara:strand:+ start:10586 stop:11005 length:420 start_codon:yes stop_codon:yes gene_type:complete